MTPAKVLVVDDTPQNVKLLADILTAKGYTAITAASGEEALSKFAVGGAGHRAARHHDAGTLRLRRVPHGFARIPRPHCCRSCW